MEKRNKEEDLKVVDRFWPEITPDEVQQVLSYYPSLGNFLKIVSQSSRPLSAGCLFETSEGKFFLKRNSQTIRTKEDWTYEHKFQKKLKNFGITVPRVLENSFQETILELKNPTETWLYEIQESCPGEDVYHASHTWSPLQNEAHAGEIGAVLARFHKSSLDSGFLEERSPRYQTAKFQIFYHPDISSFCRESAKNIPQFSKLKDPQSFAEEVAKVYEKFSIPTLENAKVAPLVTHGDPHASNFFWKGNQAVGLIDFHLSNQTNHLYDLAVAIDRNTLYWLDILSGKKGSFHTTHAIQICKKYQETAREIGYEPPSLDLLPRALVLHRIEFALSLLDYYLNVENSPFKAQWCLDVYILAHGKWFHTEEGESFLRSLQESCEGN